MLNTKNTKILTALLVAFVLTIAMAACGSQEDDSEESSTEATTAEAETIDDMDALMEQVAQEELILQYKDYLIDKAFAKIEEFGMDTEGDPVTAYTMLCTGEYVALKDKAYNVSGAQGEAIIKYHVTEEGPVLDEVIWSEDGSNHDPWVEENFSKEALEKLKAYDAYDADGKSKLEQEMNKDVEEEMDVAVETENLLEINGEEGTYKIVKTIESGDPASDDYQFDTEVVEEGLLSDVNS